VRGCGRESAVNLVDDVFPGAAVRQFVLAVPLYPAFAAVPDGLTVARGGCMNTVCRRILKVYENRSRLKDRKTFQPVVYEP